MAVNKYAYLGTSVEYPLTITQGRLVTVSGATSVENSIIMILMTPIGTRLLLPEYGSRLSELQFEPNDEVVARILSYYTLEALNRWEKRARFLDVSVLILQDAALCTIRYKLVSSNEELSFVFPYFRGAWNF